jgi:hypothetical protein
MSEDRLAQIVGAVLLTLVAFVVVLAAADLVDRGSTFAARTSGLGAGGGKGKRSKRKPISPATKGQRGKVLLESQCRVCKIEVDWATLDPAHVIDRSLGGCDSFECIVPLCRKCHDLYDDHKLDLLAFLKLAEQAHAVSHLGLSRAYKRITGSRPDEQPEGVAA